MNTPALLIPRKERLSLLRRDGLHARAEAALVAGGGVLVQGALLHALVQRGDGGTVLLGHRLGVTLLQGLTQQRAGCRERGSCWRG